MKRYLQKYFSVAVAAALLLTMTACSNRQPPAEEINPPSTPNSTDTAQPPAEETQPAIDEPTQLPESDPNLQTWEENPDGTEFEIDTVKFELALPEGWTAKGNEIYAADVKIAALLPCVPNSDGKAFESLDAQYTDAEVVRECTASNYSGKSYHMQSEVSEGGLTVLANELLYYIDIDDQLLHFAFYPLHGIGIGTQREEFETMLNTIVLHP